MKVKLSGAPRAAKLGNSGGPPGAKKESIIIMVNLRDGGCNVIIFYDYVLLWMCGSYALPHADYEVLPFMQKLPPM